MALTTHERNTVQLHLVTRENLVYIQGELILGSRKSVEDGRKNYAALGWWLKSMLLIVADEAGILEVAEMIRVANSDGPRVNFQLSSPPPLDVAAEIKKIKDECGHAAPLIDGIYVQLDIDQNKHQPASLPIGTRGVNGEKFGTYATKAWHVSNTIKYMAEWAKGLTNLVEGRQTYHGQSVRVDIKDVDTSCCFEGYCTLLGGKKYVSFHCYPNSRS
jgi:hypothetical protein